MAFFHFDILRKYTASLLYLFNNLEVRHKLSDGKFDYTKIPIQYSNREKFDVYDQLSYSQIFTGNTQVLPRAILIFAGMTVDLNRKRNKFFKIYRKILNVKEDGIEKKKKLNYQFNSIPYNFAYQVIIQCRGMSEASMIAEQITSYFNPSYCMRIQEIDLPDFGYTSIILTLDGINIEQSEFDELSTNIVTISLDLTMKGNIYPAIKEQETIQLVQLFISSNVNNSNDVSRVTSIAQTPEQKLINQYKTIIKDVLFDDIKLECLLDSECEKLIKFQFDWYINDNLLEFHDKEIYLDVLNEKIKDGDIVKVKAYTDIVESEFFIKEFFDKPNDITEMIVIKKIKYEDDFLECIFDDNKVINSDLRFKYKFRWFINNQELSQHQRIVKYKSDVNFGVKVIIESSDGRKDEKYEMIYINALEFNDLISFKDYEITFGKDTDDSIIQDYEQLTKSLNPSDLKINTSDYTKVNNDRT